MNEQEQKKYDRCPVCDGWMHHDTYDSAGGPYMDKLEQIMNTLADAASRLLDEGPFSDEIHASWACCGAHWDQVHRGDCPYVATQQAIEQAHKVLPKEEASSE